MSETITFKGSYANQLFRSDNFAIIAFNVDKKSYPNLLYSEYKNVVVSGEFPPLQSDVEYEVKVKETTSKKYGKTYKLVSLSRDLPKTKVDVLNFLSQVLTYNQAHEIYREYPDIIERIKDNNLDDIDLSKMSGITVRNFDRLIEKVQSNLFALDLISIFNGAVSLTNIYKLLEKYKSVEMVKIKMTEEPYKCLCGLSGIGFKRADAILLSLQSLDNPPIKFSDRLETSRQRCKACVLYQLSENETGGNTKIRYSALKEQMFDIVPEAVPHFDDVITDKEIYFDKENMFISLFETFKKETEIVKTICNQIKQPSILNISGTVEDYSIVDGVSLTEQQVDGLRNLINNKISIINGVAGAGKTYSTKAIINMLNKNYYSVLCCSPTGKASKVLESYTNYPSSTIHRALGYNPSNPYPWTYNKENPLRESVIIVDEFSMVDIRLFWHLLDAIDFSRSRLLLIGDNAQLPSVSCGNLLHDFLQIDAIPKTTLDKVFRYQEGGLMTIATNVRVGKPYLNKGNVDKVSLFGENKDYCYIDVGQDKGIFNTVKLYNKLLEQGNLVSDIMVLSPKNVGNYGTKVLNNALQRVANKDNYGSQPLVEISETKYYIGDIVLQQKNNYDAVSAEYEILEALEHKYDGWSVYSNWNESDAKREFIANGETGVIEDIFSLNGKIRILIDWSGIKTVYSKSDMLDVSLGYAMTIHKSQGSSSKIVIMLTSKSDIFMLNSNLLYVGLTRASERCYHVGQYNTVNMAIKKKANLNRDTWIIELFEKELGENFS